MPSFIDTMQPITTAEKVAWKLYLSLPHEHWVAARIMFRRARNGTDPATNLLQFVDSTGYADQSVITKLERPWCMDRDGMA
jgi:hypothetical protein